MTNEEKIEKIRLQAYESIEQAERAAEAYGPESKVSKVLLKLSKFADKVAARRVALLQLEDPKAKAATFSFESKVIFVSIVAMTVMELLRA